MRTVLSYLKQYRRESILAPAFKMLEVLFDLLVPLVVAQMIDVGVASGDRVYILQRVLLLIGFAFLGMACSFTAQYFAAKASVGTAASLRQAVYSHIQSLSYGELDRLGTGTLITRLTDDINQIQNGLNLALRLLLRSPLIVFGAMVMAFTVNVSCALIFAAAIPVLAAVVFFIMLVTIPLFKKAQSRLDGITELTRESLTGVRVIRAFCREQEAVREFDEKNRELTRLNVFVGGISALLNPLTYVLVNLATIVLIDRAGLQVNLGNMGQGDAVALYNYMAQMIVELIKLASLVISINKAMACAGRVEKILEVKPGLRYPETQEETEKETAGKTGGVKFGQPAEKAEKSARDAAVEFSHVSFTYPGAAAPSLSGLDFRVEKGQTLGIIGGTGSGKTSLVNLIGRFYDATEGQVWVNGKDVRNYKKGELPKKIGIVPQKAVLCKGTIRENLRWGNEGRFRGGAVEGRKDRPGGGSRKRQEGRPGLYGGAERTEPVGRPEAAADHCQGVSQASGDFDPGRQLQCLGFGDGRGVEKSAAGREGRYDGGDRIPEDLQHPRSRPDPGAGGRAAGGLGHP